jgi:Rod binding domain-containing protein
MTAAPAVAAPGFSALDLINTAQETPGKLNGSTSAKAHAAAQNFESVFLNTMFQQMTTGIDGDGPFGGSGALGVWRSLLTDAYARGISKAGGVGIASHVYKELMALQEKHS